jgi:hypothetical protein
MINCDEHFVGCGARYGADMPHKTMKKQVLSEIGFGCHKSVCELRCPSIEQNRRVCVIN